MLNLLYYLTSSFVIITFINLFSKRAPDTAPTKSKMLYAGTKDTLKKNLQGLQVEMQGTDKSEVDQSEVLAKCQSLSK